jgi:hypothetical protein
MSVVTWRYFAVIVTARRYYCIIPAGCQDSAPDSIHPPRRLVLPFRAILELPQMFFRKSRLPEVDLSKIRQRDSLACILCSSGAPRVQWLL